jgi:hypothetical protein
LYTSPLTTDSTNQDDIQSIDSLLLDLSTLRAATDNFAESNKLGEGGFGSVYKVPVMHSKLLVASSIHLSCGVIDCLGLRRVFFRKVKK